jgi:DNA ligase-1
MNKHEDFTLLHEVYNLAENNPSAFLFLDPDKYKFLIENGCIEWQKNSLKKKNWFRPTKKLETVYLNYMEQVTVKTTLYSEDSKGRIRMWEGWVSPDEQGIFYTDGLMGGKMKTPTFKESREINVGKSNYVTKSANSYLMLQQEVEKKIKDNYFYTIAEVQNQNPLEKFRPMLATPHDKVKITYPCLVQPKLDGARCNALKLGLKSREGRDFISTPHIFKSLQAVFKFLETDFILDGELYNHTLKDSFEKIMSLIRKTKPELEDLIESRNMIQYHIYDILLPNKPNTTQLERLKLLNSLRKALSNIPYIKFVKTILVENAEQMEEAYNTFLQEGYEGMIIRNLSAKYDVNLRSKNLIKRKDFEDAEFEILDILEGEGTWAGAAKKVVIRLDENNTQECGLAGTFENNIGLLVNKQHYIGKKATVTYFGRTAYNELRFPVIKDINRQD